MDPPPVTALSSLQSKAQVELLDAIDKLRADGFSGELDLPQLIVCGKQSCGKSSVLEAISQVRFPAADTACTRFATELVLRRANTSSMSVELIPAPHREGMDRSTIARFEAPEELIESQDLEGIIKAAENHIDDFEYPDCESSFYQDKLRAIVHGPNLPPLTLVDLPGLIRTRENGTENIDVVEKVVRSYMCERSSIILAVVTADDDLANQGVLEMAKSYDPEGTRTLGIFTKPDKVEAGSPAENAAILCAQNERFHLGLGWHVLKNRGGHAHRDDTSVQRDKAEEAFFVDSRWNAIAEDSRGVKALRQRLSDVLFRSITKNLPTLVTSIHEKISTCETNLRKLGEPKSTEQEQRVELTDISSKVASTIKSSLDGYYDGDFFQHASQQHAPIRQLRSRLRNILDDFSKQMKDDGQYYCFVKSSDPSSGAASFSSVPALVNIGHRSIKISFHAAEKAASEHIRANRGLEPPGFPPSGAVAHMFRVQSSPWKVIAKHCIDQCWSACESLFVYVVEHFAAPHIARAIMSQLAGPKLAFISMSLEAKLEELLKPYKKGYPITLDITRSLRSVGDSLSHEKPLAEDYVAWRALECLDTYYKIAVATFPETVATLAIENCLVDGLLEIFSPMTVATLDAEALRALTAEPEHVAAQRTFNLKRLSALQSISSVFSRHGSGYRGQEVYGSQNGSHPREDYFEPATAPEFHLSDVEAVPFANGSSGPLTPPKTPNETSSRKSSPSNAPVEPATFESAVAADKAEVGRGMSASPRRSTPRRKNHDEARTPKSYEDARTHAALRESTPHYDALGRTARVLRRQAFAESTTDSELEA